VPPRALLLVLVAAICHTTWNLALKRATDRLQIQTVALTAAVVVSSPILLVYSVRDLSPTAWLLVLLSALFETGYVFALIAAYGAGDLSLVYPVARGSAALLVVPLAMTLLGERPSPSGLLGIGLVLVGIFASHGPPEGLVARAGERPAGYHRGLALALLTGSMTAGYSLVNKVGVREAPLLLYGYLVFAGNVILVHVIVWLRDHLGAGRRAGAPRRRRLHADDWWRAGGMGLLMLIAYVCVLSAMALAPVSYVVAAREVGVVVAAALGTLVLGERHSARRIVAAGVIFAGLLVIALSR
jgi:drug/metabolite transporter (DMT)-like permease